MKNIAKLVTVTGLALAAGIGAKCGNGKKITAEEMRAGLQEVDNLRQDYFEKCSAQTYSTYNDPLNKELTKIVEKRKEIFAKIDLPDNIEWVCVPEMHNGVQTGKYEPKIRYIHSNF